MLVKIKRDVRGNVKLHKQWGKPDMKRCEKCWFRARYDNNPQSILGRIWKWHIGWCPGWKAYSKSLEYEGRKRLSERYR
jgi:hypothetical protein